MANLFIIAGHGAGDPGACAGGYTEADLVRRLANRMKALGGSSVTVGDTNRNWFATNYCETFSFPAGAIVMELHMDSFSGNAKGAHVEIKKGFSPDKYDVAIGKFLKEFMPGRADAGGIRYRSDLNNMNDCARRGVNYRLVELGFITNDGDRNKFINQMDDLARGLLKACEITAGNTAPSQPSQPQQPSNPTSTGYRVKVTADVLNIRKGPGTNYGTNGSIKDHGVYTITAESSGQGASKWGKLKSGAGWISLDFVKRVDGSSTPAAKPSTPATIKVGSKVRVTNPVDYNGTHLGVSGTYTVMEIKGDRVVIGRNGVVTAAIRKSNLALA